MELSISYSNPCSQWLQIEISFIAQLKGEVNLSFASWRPGRYEIANFAKNIAGFQSTVPFKKTAIDSYQIQADVGEEIVVRYDYWAGVMDAGNSWLDEEQVYINFINLFPKISGSEEETVQVYLEIPEHYKTATALKKENEAHLLAHSYEQLVDSPIISSAALEMRSYEVRGTEFHIWVNGQHNLDWSKTLADFEAFTKAQVEMFGGFPSEEYHFLIQALPYRHYHGVEHKNSTVITLGPGVEIGSKYYDDLLGVSSHELFHCWNVTRMRPEEMTPYDFSKIAFHNTGFLTEGLTTYYGDLMLRRAGVFNDADYIKELALLLNRHFSNNGRFEKSLLASSQDLWLNGYQAGPPHNKASIYIKGALSALILDLKIRLESGGEKSLDDVVLKLWELSFKSGKGYSFEMYETIVKDYLDDADQYFEDCIRSTKDLKPLLKEVLLSVGITVVEQVKSVWAAIGLILTENEVKSIHPESAVVYQFMIADKIEEVNGVSFADFDAKEIIDKQLSIIVNRRGVKKEIVVNCESGSNFYPEFTLEFDKENKIRENWLSKL